MIQFVVHNWYLFLALVVVLVLLVLPNIMQRIHGIASLAPSQCVLLVNRESGVFVDVSEPSEFKTGHIANAINVPMNMVSQATPQLDKHKERPVIVVARVPNRALKAATALRKRGFASVHLLSGGLAAWEKESLPLERS
ncbi:MAG TPA: rhodanese-like domain-containing protein [Burkholderiales bacterium]